MISVEEALRFAGDNFPKGPESLVEHLGLEVLYAPLEGCDGWCLTKGDKAIIRINRNMVISRQRFTLAHELGHFLLRIPSPIGESFKDMIKSNSQEEKLVNDFASRLLIPENIVKQHVTELPIIASVLRRLARSARVSELAVALRVARLSADLGLDYCSVLFFENDNFSWQWSESLEIPRNLAEKLLARARDSAPLADRLEDDDKKVIVTTIIENLDFCTTTLFVQLLPSDTGNRLSLEEEIKQAAMIFKGHESFRNVLEGRLSQYKNRAAELSTGEAYSDFWQRYGNSWDDKDNDFFCSNECQHYLWLRLSKWCKE